MSHTYESCCVEGCTSKSNVDQLLTFHQCPAKNKSKVKITNFFGEIEEVDKHWAWKKSLNLPKEITPRVVCSLHFEPEDYIVNNLPDFPTSIKRLKQSAIPSKNLLKTARDLKNEARGKRSLKRINDNVKTVGTGMDEVFTENVEVNDENDQQTSQITVSTQTESQQEDKEFNDPVLMLMKLPSKQQFNLSVSLTTDKKLCTATGLSSFKILHTIVKIFENTRVVLDCTEVNIERPKKLCCQVIAYSNYKGTTTMKFMTGVSPAGTITFVSDAYGGRVSDTTIFGQSEVINLLEPGDAVMVDKGFMIEDLCLKNRWKCIRPPFLREKKQFSEAEAISNAKIACARVHVERANQRIKKWSIVGAKMPAHLLPVANEIFKVLCATVNLSAPILSDKHFMCIN
ncbi:hypothetical protein TKK_0003165 [Trichogramma kaykai]|uniref:THAP-type domain-containing protein n=1 Tax=Trichogramma kaykai TaxID=54128 RepID=A0ABD2WSY5_9HYME